MLGKKTKILVVRFSSIGDIVLTTPVLRNIKKTAPSTELHYLTKSSFKSILTHNPNVDKVWAFNDNLAELVHLLKAENFDYVIDLHKNLRSFRLKKKLNVPSFSYNKLNFSKFLLSFFKINILSNKHIVDRYLDCTAALGVKNDNEGLDYFISSESEKTSISILSDIPPKFTVVVIGAAHRTKVPPIIKYSEIINKLNRPCVLIGGDKDIVIASEIFELIANKTLVYNLCGKTSLEESAAIIRSAELVVTPDTGMMHIAAAFQRPIISLWGNTVPNFGMTPYYGSNETRSFIAQVNNLSCRPCSKIGHDRCPKKHFDCMNKLNVDEIKNWLNNSFAE